MSIRDKFPPAKLPQTHYFLTVSRGDKVRALAVRPIYVWAAIIAVPVFGLWACGATAFVALHDTVVTTLVSREAEIETTYQTKLADAHAELDRMASRRLIDQDAFDGKMRDLLSRQARLEQRGVALAALAAETSADVSALAQAKPKMQAHVASALSAIEAIGGGAPSDSDLGPARAYAPIAAPPAATNAPRKPHPLETGPENLSRVEKNADRFAGELASAAGDSTLDPTARIGLVGYSLDRVERAQTAALTGVTRAAHNAAQHMATVIERTGLSVATLKAPEPQAGGMGGPFIPLDVGKESPAFEAAVADASHEIERARKLRQLMPHIPLRYPLIGDASMSSPFGYRPDPFLGRPALHPGVDLVQAYGADIKATAIGRVTHAGPMGGYGNAVEIDHGNGIATRYGHMSEVLVEEGQMVKPGDTIGRIGSTGRSTGPHLHYEVRIDNEPVDPERFLTAAKD